jgi:small subunit ribosomal protein S6
MYEGMFLLDSNRYAREPNVVSDQISQMLKKLGADVLVSRLWSEQRLAYPIKGHRKGTYWLTYFRMEKQQVARLERESQLNHNVLRSLFLTVDERLADTLVQHATAGSSASRSSQESEAEGTRDAAKTGGQAKETAAASAQTGSDADKAPASSSP